MKTKRLLGALVLCAAVVLPGSRLGIGEPATPAPASDVNITISARTIGRLVEAALPYRLQIETALFSETVVFSDPREIRLIPGGLRLQVTATGQPIPFVASLSPEVRVVEDPATGELSVHVRELATTIGWLGTYDLASFIDPIPIERMSSYLLEWPGGGVGVDLMVEAIDISETAIDVRMKTSFP